MRRALRIFAVLLAAGVLYISWRLGAFELFADPERLRQALQAQGAWGYAEFLAAFAFLQPIGAPGIVFVLGATYVWPKPIAFALSVVGSLCASAVGFGFARFVARDFVESRMPPKLRQYDAKIAKNGFLWAIFLRLLFQMNPFVHGLFGLSRVRFATYMFGSTIGYIPALFVIVYVGPEAFEVVRAQPVERFIAAAGVIAALVVTRWTVVWQLRKRANRRAELAAASEPPAGD
jgi:uncharacterized membrane protein YdjX (TVP38/TMEM64 family)